MAAVVAGGAFPGDVAAQMTLLKEAGTQLLDAREGLHGLRARTGVAQNVVETAKAERTAERGVYDLTRARILGADTFEAASTYQALLSQLEATFTVTARLASLRFTNFMR